MKWILYSAIALILVNLTLQDGEIWEEDDHEVLIRNARGTDNKECRYDKGAWSECDTKTNMRSRSLTLKKGNQTSCEPNKTIQKKCKKACRYTKGTWGECNIQRTMTRIDRIKANSDTTCEASRQITKKCKPKGTKPGKGKGKDKSRNRQ